MSLNSYHSLVKVTKNLAIFDKDVLVKNNQTRFRWINNIANFCETI